MKTKTDLIGFSHEPPELWEPYQLSLTLNCRCKAILIATITRTVDGIIFSSVDLACPNCRHDHQRLLEIAGNILDTSMNHTRRLASLN